MILLGGAAIIGSLMWMASAEGSFVLIQDGYLVRTIAQSHHSKADQLRTASENQPKNTPPDPVYAPDPAYELPNWQIEAG